MPFSSAYQTAAAKREISPNYYVQISGSSNKYSKKAVSGITTFVILDSLTFNPSKIALESVKTSIGSMTVGLIDPSGNFLAELAAGPMHEKTLSLYVGFEDIAGSAYQKIAEYGITDVKYDGKLYSVTARDRLAELTAPITVTRSVLSADVAAAATSIALADASAFPTSGKGKLGDEVVTWTGKSGNTLTPATRGVDGSDAQDHDAGEDLFLFTTITGNPITLALQLMISPGGGGTYDTLSIGLGRSQTRFNLTAFQNARDNSILAGQSWTFDIAGDIEDALAFIEKEILYFTNSRLFVDIDGLISLALVEQVTLDNLAGSLLEEEVEVSNFVRSAAESNRIQNRIRIKYDWDEGRGEYKKELPFNDTTSQARYGVIDGQVAASKGIRAGQDGDAIIQDFAERLLARVAFPTNRFTDLRTLWSKQFFDIGQKVRFDHPDVVDVVRGVKGVNRVVEVLEKRWDFDQGLVSYQVNASERLSENWCFISPTSPIVATPAGNQVTLATGEVARAGWEAGWVIAIWTTAGVKVGAFTINSIAGEVLTLSGAHGGSLTDHVVQFADYDEVVEAQKVYGFLSNDTTPFADGRTPYLITD